MTAERCQQITIEHFADYTAGELTEAEAAKLQEHLFACAECGDRAAEFEALIRAIPSAVRSADVTGFVTDDVLNRLAREGVHVRTFVLTPGAVVPCAVWEDDEVMVLRLRGDLGGASEVTMSQRVGGDEVLRASGHVAAGARDEVIYTLSAAWFVSFPS